LFREAITFSEWSQDALGSLVIWNVSWELAILALSAEFSIDWLLDLVLSIAVWHHALVDVVWILDHTSGASLTSVSETTSSAEAVAVS
jgi:hypothetical protein